MRLRRAYRAGQIAWHQGLPPDAPANTDEEWRVAFRRGYQDERRRTINGAGRPRVLHR